MNGHARCTLENEQDLLTGRTRRDSGPDVAARALEVQVRARSIQPDKHEFNELDRQNPVSPGIRRHFYGLLRHAGSHSRSLLSATAQRRCLRPSQCLRRWPYFPPFWLSLADGRVLVALDEIAKLGDGVFLLDGIAGHVLQSFRQLNPSLKNSPFYPLKLSTQASNQEGRRAPQRS